MKKIALFILLCAMSLCTAFAIAACGGAGETLEPMPALDPVYGVDPGEGIVIDGEADETLWQGKSYFHNRDDNKNVGYWVTTHLTGKGVYIFAYSEDGMVCYSNRNNYRANSHFYFILTAKEGQQTYNEGVCRSMKIDVTAYTMPTNFSFTAKSAIDGEVNSGETRGMSVEVFVSWEQLGIGAEEERPEEVKLYSAYMAVPRINTNGEYIANTFASTAPCTHQRYDTDGYINTVDDVLGVSAFGTANSGGFERTEKRGKACMNVTAGGDQTAYFDLFSDSFAISATVRSNGRAYNGSTIARAGLLLSLPTGFYSATMFDLRVGSGANVNAATGAIKNNRLIELTNYPGGSLVRTNVPYEGVDSPAGYESLKLTVIKERSIVYYIVNDELVGIEELEWMSGAVRAGVYASNADCTFEDYSFTDCSGDPAALREMIAQYAVKVQYYNDANLKFSADAPAVMKGENAKVDLFVRSGQTLDRLFNNGVDVTDQTAESYGTLVIDPEERDVSLTATTKEIQDFVKISGRVTFPNGSKAPYADINVMGEKKYTSYYTSADMDGAFEVMVDKNNRYVIAVAYDGYRTVKVDVSVAEGDVSQDIALENYRVGGAAGSYKSNTSAWDLSQESDSIVTLNLQDRASGGPIYFSDVVSDTVVIQVTMTNITNQIISEPYYKTNSNANGEYENDPGMGIFARSGNGSSYYMAYYTGYRIRWDNGSYANMELNTSCTTEAHSMRTAGNSVKMTLMRYKSQFFVYLDYGGGEGYGELVFKQENTRIRDAEAVYGLTFDSSAILTVRYSDYWIKSGAAAEEIIFDKLYSEIDYDKSLLTIDGLTQHGGKEYGLYNTDLTIRAKDVREGDVCKVSVGGESYYLTARNNSLTYKLTAYSSTSMPVYHIGCEKSSGQSVSGKVNVAADIAVVDAARTIHAYGETDGEGNYSFYLPDGEYDIIAQANGYMGKHTHISVQGAAVTAEALTLESELLGSKAVLGADDIASRTSAYKYGFNEAEMRHSVRVDNNGNGGAIYFKETAENVAISFSFVNNGGSEPDPGIGIWTTARNEPANNGPSLRTLFKAQSTDLLWRKTAGDDGRGWASQGSDPNCKQWNAGYDLRKDKNVVYDAVFVRYENVYYLFIKGHGEETYRQAVQYKTDIIGGEAAYGLSITASPAETIDVEFFDYGLVSDKSAVGTKLNELLGQSGQLSAAKTGTEYALPNKFHGEDAGL